MGLLLLAACGSHKDGAVAFSSGSRLRAHYFEADGVRVLIDFFDSQLGFPCTFRATSDGRFHCVPVAQLGVEYSDSACTQPVLVATSSADTCGPPPAPFAVTFDSGGYKYCGRQSPLTGWPVTATYAAGDALSLTSYYQPGSAGSCTHTDTVAVPSPAFSATAIDFNTLVGATERDVSRGDGLGVRLLEADDGARFALGLYDVIHDRACGTAGTLAAGPTASTLCLPDNTPDAPYYFFGDATCSTQPLAYADKACDSPAYVIGGAGPDFCVGLSTVALAGTPIEASNVFSLNAGSCSPVMTTEFNFFGVGEEVAPGVLPGVRSKQEGAGGRLVQYSDATESGLPVGFASNAGFVDVQAGATCIPNRGADGVLRCVPAVAEASYDQGLFSDAECSQEIAMVPSCKLSDEKFGVRRGPCGVAEGAFELGAEVTVSAAYLNTVVTSPNGPPERVACYLAGSYPSLRFRAVGPPLGLDVFAEIAERTE